MAIRVNHERKRVLVIARSYEASDAGYRRLEEAGYETVVPGAGAAIDRSALAAAIENVDAAIIGTQRFDSSMLRRNGRLRVIVKAGAGVDNVDLEAAHAAGIVVASLPGVNASAVAEYSVALMLAVCRRLREVDSSVRSGEWRQFRGGDLVGSTVGVVGLGNVGRAVCGMLSGFGVKILGLDIADSLPAATDVTMASLDKIAAESDFITLHVPLTPQTRHLVNSQRLSAMKASAVLVNTARGGLVDTDALYDALQAHTVAGAGLDVFEREPFNDARFFALENVVLSSHNASYTVATTERTVIAAADTLIRLDRRLP